MVFMEMVTLIWNSICRRGSESFKRDQMGYRKPEFSEKFGKEKMAKKVRVGQREA